MEQINPYEALTQSREGSFSNEALEDNAALLSDAQAKVEEKQQKLDEAAAGPSATAMDAEQEIQEVKQKEEKKTNDGLKQYTDTLAILRMFLSLLTPLMSLAKLQLLALLTLLLMLSIWPLPISLNFLSLKMILHRVFVRSLLLLSPLFLSRLGIKGGQLANAKVNAAIKIPKLGTWNIAKDPLVKLFSMGLEAGVGAAVDYTSSTSKEGLLQAQWRNTCLSFFIDPDDIAVLDDDHPDVKRDKSVKEGVALGLFTDLLLGAIRGKFLPENETARLLKDPNCNKLDNEKVVDVMGAAKDSVETSLRHVWMPYRPRQIQQLHGCQLG